MKIRQLSEQEIMTVSGGNATETECMDIMRTWADQHDVNDPSLAAASFMVAQTLYSLCENGQLDLSES